MAGAIADEAYGLLGNRLFLWKNDLVSIGVRSFWFMFEFLYTTSQAYDGPESKEVVQLLARRLAEIPPDMTSQPGGTLFCHSKLSEWAKRLLAGVAVCRSVRKLDPSFCEPLSVLGEDKRECCKARAAFTLMLAGKCSKDTADKVAAGMNVSPAEWTDNCRALKSRDSARCRELNEGRKGFGEMCEALIARAYEPCRRIGDEELKNDCLASVETIRLLERKNTLEAILKSGPVDQCMHMHLAAVKALNSSAICGVISLALLGDENVLADDCASFVSQLMLPAAQPMQKVHQGKPHFH